MNSVVFELPSILFLVLVMLEWTYFNEIHDILCSAVKMCQNDSNIAILVGLAPQSFFMSLTIVYVTRPSKPSQFVVRVY